MQFDPERHLVDLFQHIGTLKEDEGIFMVPDSASPEAGDAALRKGAASGFAIPPEFSPKDSPTMQSVSPLRRSNETLSTARTSHT